MTQRYYGEAKNLLMAALSSEYQHPKLAIAVDRDVDIFNHSEVLWASGTRVNPAEDVVVIPGTHNHAMDAACPELGAPGTALWQRRGGKLLIDATIPPPADAAARAQFERIRPVQRRHGAPGRLRGAGVDGHRERAVTDLLRVEAAGLRSPGGRRALRGASRARRGFGTVGREPGRTASG